MSIKIYNGYKIQNQDLPDVLDMLRGMQPRMKEALTDNLYGTLVENATSQLDAVACGRIPEQTRSSLVDCFMDLMEQAQDSETGYSCKVVILPVESESEMLALLYTEKDFLKDSPGGWAVEAAKNTSPDVLGKVKEAIEETGGSIEPEDWLYYVGGLAPKGTDGDIYAEVLLKRGCNRLNDLPDLSYDWTGRIST